jgi:hypothetical protein
MRLFLWEGEGAAGMAAYISGAVSIHIAKGTSLADQ